MNKERVGGGNMQSSGHNAFEKIGLPLTIVINVCKAVPLTQLLITVSNAMSIIIASDLSPTASKW